MFLERVHHHAVRIGKVLKTQVRDVWSFTTSEGSVWQLQMTKEEYKRIGEVRVVLSESSRSVYVEFVSSEKEGVSGKEISEQ